MDPATKQYIIFSAVVSIVLSFLVNFFLINAVKGGFAYGFPLNLSNVSGFLEIIYRLVNTAVVAAILTLPLYWFMIWAYRRATGG